MPKEVPAQKLTAPLGGKTNHLIYDSPLLSQIDWGTVKKGKWLLKIMHISWVKRGDPMAIPDYQTIMLPLLRVSGDGQEHTLGDTIEQLAQEFGLGAEDRRELLLSGQPKFDNRVAWARTYLKKAGLLEATARGRFRISERGLQVLRSNPEKIDNRFLTQFPEFREFRPMARREGEDDTGPIEAVPPVPETPEEIITASYQDLRRFLAEDLLQRMKKLPPQLFEKLVLDLLIAMGYGGSREDAAQAVGRSGDEGIDGIIKEDKLGLDTVYVQAKRWEGTVGRPVVQAFAGSLMGLRASKGVFITTSQFSQDAKDYVGKIEKKIVLIDGERFVDLMIDYGIGVTEVNRYSVKRVDVGYFGEDS